MRRFPALCAAAVACLAAAVAASAAAPAPQLTQVERMPFPDRGFVVDLPTDRAVTAAAVRVHENGRPVHNLLVTPLASAGISYGVVLAVDTSDSMAGAPLASTWSSRPHLPS